MTRTDSVVLCLAFLLGLLFTIVPWGGYAVLALGIEAAILRQRLLARLLPSFWRTSPKPPIWLAAGAVGLLATLYLQARTPQPTADDISKFIAANTSNKEQIVTVQGKVESTPRLTRSQKVQFWLEATQLNEVKGEGSANVVTDVIGRLYVTVPLLQATGIHSGQAIAVTGSLYKPKPAANPGAFDFQAYLAQEGAFAGLKGRQVNLPTETTRWGWWAIRQRIIRSQTRWLGIPEGPLVSAIVLGHRVVDLPYDIQDQFIQVGLAHAIVASGFKVSLILALLLAVTRRSSQKVQFILGTAILVLYVGITGLHPPVLRAAVMGFGALVALVVQRRRKPLATLLFVATLLLLCNPVWIWDIGFELSFLATLGLMVTVPSLVKRLDWLPPAIASLIAVSVAASIWTLPLLLHSFSAVQIYSIVVNILTTPIISLISIGGIISALAALIWPLAGSASAWLLYYPTHVLLALVQFFCQLPGSSITVGTSSTLQLIALYGLLGLTWLQPWWRQRWWLSGVVAVGLVLVPVWHSQSTLFRVTVLAAPEPILVIQDRGQVVLVNSGDDSTARFTLLPFLRQQGINRIDWAINTDESKTSSGWLEVLEHIPVKNLYYPSTTQESEDFKAIQSAVQANGGTYQRLSADQKVSVGSTTASLIDGMPMWQFQIQSQTWLFLALKAKEQHDLLAPRSLPRPDVVCGNLEPNLVITLQPKVIIATSTVKANTTDQLHRVNARLFSTDRQGAIQWTPAGFRTTLEDPEDNISLL